MTDVNNNSELTALQKAAILLQRSQARVVELEHRAQEPIAIVGMACRFPGGREPKAFWQLLAEGQDAISEVPEDRWSLDTYYHPDPSVPGHMYSKWGGFLPDIKGFDADFFGISPREALRVDPQHRLLLEVAWEALEDAAILPSCLSGTKTGVFVGVIGFDYGLIQMGNLNGLDIFSGTGVSHSILANRLSYFLDAHGPSMILDTACSSSLVAIHLACQSLRKGESNLALAGGVNLMLAPEVTVTLCKAQMLSPSGRCRAFDAAADGYVRGEGAGVVVLKRLADAQRDEDHILGLIRGTAINHGGRSNGLSAPNGVAQQAVLRAALADACMEPEMVDYIEAHGTGTRLGDPVEFDALMAVYGHREGVLPLKVGSVKTNIGHLEGAAGIAGVIKMLLMMRHGAIPPHLHFEQPNPLLGIERMSVHISTRLESWDRLDKPRVGAISSFGFGGTNAHLILEEAPTPVQPKAFAAERPWHLLALSARTRPALKALILSYRERLSEQGDSLADIAFSSNTGRTGFNHRLAVWAQDGDSAVRELGDAASVQSHQGVVDAGNPPRIAFLFTGQGSQYAGMGMELYRTHPIFRAAMDRCDAILQPLLGRSVVVLIDTGDDELLAQTEFTQPILFAIEYAISELWRSWGVLPTAVMGHSAGEFCAAVVAGVLTLEEAARLIAHRAALMQALPSGGMMAAVMAPETWVTERLEGYPEVSVAGLNGPRNIVISGPEAPLRGCSARFTQEGVNVKELATSHAFHSQLMKPISVPLTAYAGSLHPRPPTLPFVSNLTGGQADELTFTDPAYWARHALEPVLFARGCETLASLGCNTFIEIGPHPTLVNMARLCIDKPGCGWLASLQRGQGDWPTLLASLGQCFVRGIEIDWRGFDAPWSRHKTQLPTYPFQREPFWFESAPTREVRISATDAEGHPLLGVPLRTPRREHLFEACLAADSPLLLRDHLVQGRVVMPAAGMWEMVLVAGRRLGLERPALAQARVLSPLLLNEPRRVQTLIEPDASGGWSFEIFSQLWDADMDAVFSSHASGILTQGGDAPEAVDPVEIRDGFRENPFDDAWRRHALTVAGLEMGPAFTWAFQHWRNETGALARMRAPTEEESRGFWLHPGYLDSGLQLLGSSLPNAGETTDTYLPVGCERLEIWEVPLTESWCLCRRQCSDPGSVRGELLFYDAKGTALARLTGVELRRAPKDWLVRILVGSLPQWLYRLDWDQRSLPLAAAPAGLAWLLLGDDDSLASALEAELQACGARVIRLAPSLSVEDLLQQVDAAATEVRIVLLEQEEVSDEPMDWSGDERRGWARMLRLVQCLTSLHTLVSLALVTRGTVSLGSECQPNALGQSLLWGLGRVVASEYPDFSCVRIDLDPARPATEAAELADVLLAGGREDQIALRDGKRLVPRLHAVRADDGMLKLPNSAGYTLQVLARGELDQISLRPDNRREPGPGQVEVRVEATGLNFRDVLNLLDLYPGDPGPLGGECAGVVTAVGEGVNGMRVGDRVMALAPASFASHICTNANWAAAIPEGMSFEEAATIPIAFLTADHALRRLAGLQAGQRVLIHAASGGLGLAALQIAQLCGAQVFATAGNPRKRAFLKAMGITEVMDSRSLDFALHIKEITGGAGVHAVLNSLTGVAIARGIECLAPGGHFLEVGKTDLWNQQRVEELNPGSIFHAIALDDMMRNQPREVGERLKALSREFHDGRLRPLTKQTYDIRYLPEALRMMSRAEHIGKLVIRAATGHGDNQGLFRSHACYLVTGGLGGLGLELAEWLADRGARDIILVSRSAPSLQAQGLIAEICSRGLRVVSRKCDIADASQCRDLLAKIDQEHAPLRGIFHLAGILDDGLLRDQSLSSFESVLAPKAQGARNLHQLTRDRPLDHFVLFSSIASIFGSPGQGNYAAANAFLDALAQHRRWWNLPAMSINWGPWAKVGMAARLGGQGGDRIKATGIQAIEPPLGFWMLEQLIWRNASTMAAVQIDWSAFAQRLPADHAPPWLQDLLSEQKGRGEEDAVQAEEWRRRLQDAPAAERFNLLVSLLQQQAVRVLGHGSETFAETHRPLNELGFDSLTGVEFCNAVGRTLGLQLNPMILFEYPTLAALAVYILNDLFDLDIGQSNAETGIFHAMKEEVDSTLIYEVAGMTDTEMEQLVEEQLKQLNLI